MLLMLRKALFYVLLILYFIFTPYMILYGMGYVFSPQEREMVKTGLVSITSEPKGATVYIEGRKFSQKTPAVVRGLQPGSYNIRVTRRGFQTWSKSVPILPEKATRLEPVVLTAQKPAFETLTTEAYEAIFPKTGEFKIFGLTEGKRLSDLNKIDLFFKKETALYKEKEISAAASYRILSWKSKKNSGIVLLKVKRENNTGYLLYDLEREKILKDLTGQFVEDADWIDWNPEKPKAIYFLKDQHLTGFNFATNLPFEIGQGGILGFGEQRGKIYFLRKDFSLWQCSAVGENVESLSKRDDNGARIFSGLRAKFYQIKVLKHELFQKELFLFVSDKGALVGNWPPYRLVESGVLGFQHVEDGNSDKILYWTKKEIGVFNFAFNTEEDMLPPRLTLYRGGENIQQAVWAFDNTHVVFQDENQIFLLEAGDHAPYLLRPLQSAAAGTQMLYHERQNSIYSIDPQSRKIIKRKIAE